MAAPLMPIGPTSNRSSTTFVTPPAITAYVTRCGLPSDCTKAFSVYDRNKGTGPATRKKLR